MIMDGTTASVCVRAGCRGCDCSHDLSLIAAVSCLHVFCCGGNIEKLCSSLLSADVQLSGLVIEISSHVPIPEMCEEEKLSTDFDFRSRVYPFYAETVTVRMDPQLPHDVSSRYHTSVIRALGCCFSHLIMYSVIELSFNFRHFCPNLAKLEIYSPIPFSNISTDLCIGNTNTSVRYVWMGEELLATSPLETFFSLGDEDIDPSQHCIHDLIVEDQSWNTWGDIELALLRIPRTVSEMHIIGMLSLPDIGVDLILRNFAMCYSSVVLKELHFVDLFLSEEHEYHVDVEDIIFIFEACPSLKTLGIPLSSGFSCSGPFEVQKVDRHISIVHRDRIL